MDLHPLVPQEWCLACRRCCRFADPHDAQTPALSAVEVRRAVAVGGRPEWFAPLPASASHGVRLAAHPCGGSQCPALDAATHQCRIYRARPLDCRLYPMVVTRDASQQRLLLGVDTKCPYVRQLGSSRSLRDYGHYIACWLDSAEGQQAMVDNPALAGRPREEFWTIAMLHDPAPVEPAAPPDGFSPIAEHWTAFEAALNAAGRPLGAYHRAAWAAWQDLMRLWWGALGGVPCLLAEQAGGYFLALPPLGHITPTMLREAFQQLDTLNHGAAVSRIENVPEPLAEQCRGWGYVVRPVEREYLYDRAALVARVEARRPRAPWRIRPYRMSDAEACRQVYALWALKRQSAAETDGSSAVGMIRDGLYAHRRWLEDAEALGIRGWVGEVDGAIQGYTLGTALTPETCLVLAEITTLETDGLSAALGAALGRGFDQPWVNTMGDAGLSGLAALKAADDPAFVRTAYAVTRPS